MGSRMGEKTLLALERNMGVENKKMDKEKERGRKKDNTSVRCFIKTKKGGMKYGDKIEKKGVFYC